MSFIELFDLAFNCLFIYCGCKSKRVKNKEEGLTEKSEVQIKLLEARLVKLEGLFTVCINKIACLEAVRSATGEST